MTRPSGRQPPARLGRFEVVGLLGRGAMGSVYRARDPALGRDVAVKVVHGARPDQLERFRREGQVTAGLDHPGIIRVHGVYSLSSGTVRGKNELRVWDTSRRVQVRAQDDRPRVATSMDLSADGRLLAIGTTDGVVELWAGQ